MALSRCTSFSGLVLKTELNNYAIKTDPRVLEFAKNETPQTLITQQLTTSRADFNYKKAREHFTQGRIVQAFDFLKRALHYRNDIETEAFEKFVEIQGKGLLRYKEQFYKVSEKLASSKDAFEAGRVATVSQAEALNKKDQKITQQNAAIELLLRKTQEYEAKSDRLEKQLKTTRQKLKKSKVKINELKTELKDTQTRAAQYSEENALSELEIKRIKSLRWYDKLLGKQ